MNPGPELDALVAEQVMGWTNIRADADEIAFVGPRSGQLGMAPRKDYLETIPAYSTEITAAWPLVEKLGLWVFPDEDVWIAGRPRSLSGKKYVPNMYMDETGVVDGRIDMVTAATAPLAICLAALQVAGLNLSTEHDPPGDAQPKH